jgi:hypothetical protein
MTDTTKANAFLSLVASVPLIRRVVSFMAEPADFASLGQTCLLAAQILPTCGGSISFSVQVENAASVPPDYVPFTACFFDSQLGWGSEVDASATTRFVKWMDDFRGRLRRLDLMSLMVLPLQFLSVLPADLEHLIFNLVGGETYPELPKDQSQMHWPYDTWRPCLVPPGLRVLHLWSSFNMRLEPGMLPSGLEELYFGDAFNQPIQPGVLPIARLRVLQFHAAFDQPLQQGSLPASLLEVNFGHCFNQQLTAGILPAGLRRLVLGRRFKQPLADGVLPSTLTFLSCGSGCSSSDDKYLQKLPRGLLHLCLPQDFNSHIAPGSLPPSLRILVFGDSFNQKLVAGSLPDSLQSVTFGQQYNHPFDSGVLPCDLKELAFSSMASVFDQPFAIGTLPSSLRMLQLGFLFSHDFPDGVLPAGTVVQRPDAGGFHLNTILRFLEATHRHVDEQ